MSYPILLGLAAACFLVLIAVIALRQLPAMPPIEPGFWWLDDDDVGGDPLPPLDRTDPHVRAIAEKIYDGIERGVIADDGEHYAEGAKLGLGTPDPDGRVSFAYRGTPEEVQKAFEEINAHNPITKIVGSMELHPEPRTVGIADPYQGPGSPAYEAKVQQAMARAIDVIDYRVDVLYALWRGQVSKAGIMELLRGGHDIGKFTAKRARMALDAMEVGKPMLDRVHALLDERGEEDVSVSILHQGQNVYRAILMRGGKRGTARVTDNMGQNQFVSAIIEASEKLRPPLQGSFLGAAGGPSDIFEQGPLSAKGEDGGEG